MTLAALLNMTHINVSLHHRYVLGANFARITLQPG
jgi:hypothetical protein